MRGLPFVLLLITGLLTDEIADHDDFTLDKLLTSSVPNAGTLLHLAAKVRVSDYMISAAYAS